VSKQALPSKEKLDDYFGVGCYADEKSEYIKLIGKRESFAQMVRRILNREVELKKKSVSESRNI
jgi:hypothetical protein